MAAPRCRRAAHFPLWTILLSVKSVSRGLPPQPVGGLPRFAPGSKLRMGAALLPLNGLSMPDAGEEEKRPAENWSQYLTERMAV